MEGIITAKAGHDKTTHKLDPGLNWLYFKLATTRKANCFGSNPEPNCDGLHVFEMNIELLL
jgi:hypothetical protein